MLRTLHLVQSFLTIMQQVLINIALEVFPCNAPREKPPCMAYPSLAVLCPNCQTTCIHCLQEGHLVIWLVIIYLPEKNSSIGFRKREYAGRNCIIIWGGAANHSFARREWEKATLSQMMPGHARPQQPSLLGSEKISHSVHQEMWWGVLYCMGG